MDARQGKDYKLKFATTKRVVDNQNNYKVLGADVTIDPKAIAFGHEDKTGVATVNHERFHGDDIRAGLSVAEVGKGDLPSSATGPAAQHGAAMASEQADLTAVEAEELLDAWLAGTGTAQP